MYKGAKECQVYISHCCIVDLTNMTLAFEDANSKLLDVVSVADVEVEEWVDDSLVEILRLMFGRDFFAKDWSTF